MTLTTKAVAGCAAALATPVLGQALHVEITGAALLAAAGSVGLAVAGWSVARIVREHDDSLRKVQELELRIAALERGTRSK